MRYFSMISAQRCIYLFFASLLFQLPPIQASAQHVDQNAIKVNLDTLERALYSFNYFDSLNNRPLFFSFPDEALKARDLAAHNGYEYDYYRAEQIRARYYSYNDVVNKVHEIYDSVIMKAREKGDLLNQARFTYYKGYEHTRNDEYDVALIFYNDAYNLADSLNFGRIRASTINALAVTYGQMEQYDNSLKYYIIANEKAIEAGDSLMIGLTWGNIGLGYARLGLGDSAIYYGTKSYHDTKRTNDVLGERKALNVLSMGYQLLGEHKEVLRLVDEIEEMVSPTGEVGYMITPWLNRSKSYWALGNREKAMKDINLSLETAKKVGYYSGRFAALEWKIELLEEMGDYTSALSNSKRLRYVKDSLYRSETEKRLQSMAQNFEIRERENRIQSLESLNQANARRVIFRNLAIVALVMVFLVLIILLLLINRRKLEKEKYALQEAQDKLLRSQLNPHFLFNALSSIQLFLINKGQGKEALEYLSKFAKLMRRILENSRESMVSLEDEVSTLRHYLDLQKIRFDHKFEYHIALDTERDAADIMIPPMFAQPFIENSLEHGISHRDDGMIKLWFKETEDGLSFRVEDNGIGVSRSTKTKKQESHRSLATIITHDRINILRRQLKKRIQFDIRDKINDREEVTGTEVVFELPVIYR